MSSTLTYGAAPDLRALRRDVRFRRRFWLTDVEGRATSICSAASPSSGSAICTRRRSPPRSTARGALAHLEPLRDRPCCTALRPSFRPFRRRPRVLLQLRDGGRRGGAEVGAESDGPAGRRRAPQLLSRPDARRARRHRPAREACRWEPLAPAARFAKLNDVESLAAAVGPDTAAILLEPVQGEGGSTRRRRSSSPPPAGSPTSTARSSCSTRCSRASGARAASSPGSNWRRAGRGHARQGPRQRASDRGVPGRRRGACRPRAGRPRQHFRRQSGRVRGSVRRRRDASTPTCSPPSA